MKEISSVILGLLLVCLVGMVHAQGGSTVKLPPANTDGSMSVEKAISQRRSVRGYADRKISLEQLSQLLWAAQGITDTTRGLRAAPSAGALYPLDLYVIATRVDSLQKGLYKYHPSTHDITEVRRGDIVSDLSGSLQGWAGEASAIIVFAAVYSRTAVKYGDRATRYVHIEVGHAAQNVLLETSALGLSSGVIGAFDDDRIHSLLGLPDEEAVLYVVPVGHKR